MVVMKVEFTKEKLKRKREQLIQEMEFISDDAAVGQILLLTGETLIDNVDYGMKQDY